ncbi:FUSC family protein [Nitrospirillum iridis]|uniref:Putative membrane protein YccC n=1 Tax=Nitrospirillum iridis TaxID=765888 RepID=A0A7X0ATY0_9PROT|nr:FUSC family protein [Nitrospirillum iridis]MBB6250025.1 putative membrane protein YccC [Nitrospirillum iridis]
MSHAHTVPTDRSSPLGRLARWLQARSFALTPEQIGIAEGVRAATAVALMVTLALYLDQPILSWAAFAAFWACLADPGGPFGVRLRAMGGFALIGTVMAGAISAVAALGHAWAAPALFAALFLCCLSRVYGPAATQVGVLACCVAVVAVGYPSAPLDALRLSGVFLAGSGWAVVLCLLVWRIHPYAPARRAVAAIYSELGDMAAELLALHSSGATQDARWKKHAAEHRRAVRDTIERARAAVARFSAGRGAGGDVRQALLAAIEAGERIFAGLIALGFDLEPHATGTPTDADTLPLRQLRAALTRTSREVQRSEPDRALVAYEAEVLDRVARPTLDLVGRVAQVCAQALHDLTQAWAPASEPEAAPSARLAEEAHRRRLTPARALRLALSPSSPIARHALRVALVVTATYTVTAYLDVAYAYWATMAAVVVMQPQAATTWPRTLERVVGSVTGGAGAAFLAVALPTPLWLLAAIFPLAAATIALRSVSYSLFVTFLTPLFVLVADLLHPDVTGGEGIALARAFNNTLGSIIGLAGCLILWPEREPKSFSQRLAAAVEANMRYATLVVRAGQTPYAEIDAARRAAGLASTAAEVTRQRMVLEGRRRRAHLDEAAALLETLRRLAGAATVAWLDERTDPGPPDARRIGYCEAATLRLGALVRGVPTPDSALAREGEPPDDIARAVTHVVQAAKDYARAMAANART